MTGSGFPLLYQINTRVWLTELSEMLDRTATLDDIPDIELDRLTEAGFEWVWLLSVWQTGLTGQRVSRTNAQWRSEFEETLPDLQENDIAGSGFAITGYSVHERLGGDEALARLLKRLRQRELSLMLDFVPNHTALDHPWVNDHPDYYIAGSELDLEQTSQNYVRINSKKAERILAHGRDPYFPGWPDTLQLNYANPDLQEAQIGELQKIAGQCDGVRCDMAMLVLPEVFERTWGTHSEPFWPKAAESVRQYYPDFKFMAEVYWDLEWTLQQQGFDYTYDKRLYDRLREGPARPVREHFYAGLDYQNRMARFLENHDEPRAAAAFSSDMHKAAAVITFLSPGLRFFHQGQFDGRKKRISPHLVRAPQEPVDHDLKQFYDQLLNLLHQPVFRSGQWQLLGCTSAWEGNWTSDCFIVFAFNGEGGDRRLVAVNYSDHQSQCYAQIPWIDLGGKYWLLHDQMGSDVYERGGDELEARGLYLDMPAWAYYVFKLYEAGLP